MAVDIIASYAQLGFSFAISIYFIVKMENTIKTNTKATEAQTFAINELRDEIKRN